MYTFLELFFRTQREELMELGDIQILKRDKTNNSLTIIVEGVKFTFKLNNKACWLGVTYFLVRNILIHGLSTIIHDLYNTKTIETSYTILNNTLTIHYSVSKNKEDVEYSVNMLKGIMLKLFLVTILLIPVYILIFIYEGIKSCFNIVTNRKDKSV